MLTPPQVRAAEIHVSGSERPVSRGQVSPFGVLRRDVQLRETELLFPVSLYD